MTNRVDPALRAAACARLQAVAQAEGLDRPAAGAELCFADQVRDLYQNSALPVREIARIAGITERTLYKYVQQGGWKRRNWRHARYGGGRLVPAEGAGFPHAGGPAALGPDDARQRAADYVRARRLADAASAAAAAAEQERTARLVEQAARIAAESNMRARLRILGAINRLLDHLSREDLNGAGPPEGSAAAANVRALRALFDHLGHLRASQRN